MYTIERFFWTTLQKGTIGFGWFTIIYSTIILLLNLLSLLLEHIIVFFLHVGTGVLLIIAAKKESSNLLLPCLGIKAFDIIIGSPFDLINYILKKEYELKVLFSVIIFWVLYMCVLCYGWIGVYSYYRQLKGANQYTSTASNTRGQV